VSFYTGYKGDTLPPSNPLKQLSFSAKDRCAIWVAPDRSLRSFAQDTNDFERLERGSVSLLAAGDGVDVYRWGVVGEAVFEEAFGEGDLLAACRFAPRDPHRFRREWLIRVGGAEDFVELGEGRDTHQP